MGNRKIIHVDMDAFYASVEIRENPKLKGLPVIVGGRPEDRGVVATCSYEARKFGIHSAMATSRAIRLCPEAVLVYPHFDLYVSVSHDINSIFHEYTDLVEPLSLDEAYLDVTWNKKNMHSAILIACEIKKKILQKTGLTASAGVSYNKFLAKAASGYRKPDGLTVVRPMEAQAFIDRLPIGNFFGVGKVTEKYMIELGIRNGSDLAKKSLEELTARFGKSGIYFYNLARGIDDSPVEPYRERQSIGREITLPRDILDRGQVESLLAGIAHDVESILEEYKTAGRTITLKIKYFDFKLITRSVTLPEKISDSDSIYMEAVKLLDKTEAGIKRIRLAGISVSGFGEKPPRVRKSDGLLPFKEIV